MKPQLRGTCQWQHCRARSGAGPRHARAGTDETPYVRARLLATRADCATLMLVLARLHGADFIIRARGSGSWLRLWIYLGTAPPQAMVARGTVFDSKRQVCLFVRVKCAESESIRQARIFEGSVGGRCSVPRLQSIYFCGYYMYMHMTWPSSHELLEKVIQLVKITIPIPLR